MPNIVLTAEFINAHRTERGAWTRAQLEAIGVEWPPRSGWMNDVIGDTISGEQADQFIAGAGTFSARTLKRQRKIEVRKHSTNEKRRERACVAACKDIPNDFLEWPGAANILLEAYDLYTSRSDCR